MIETSDGYKTAIKADSERDTFEVKFGFVPPGSVEGGNTISSAEAIASKLPQVTNGVLEMGAKWATLEPNRFRLDGSCTLLDDNDEQVGFFSQEFCGEDGVFLTPPRVDYIFDVPYDLIGISVYFDAPGSEWATSVTVTYYGADGTALQTKDFANTAAVCQIDMQQIAVKQFRISINSWNVPQRMAKIAQVLPGQIYLFTPENAYEFSFSETINPFESALTLPEFSIVFDNADKKFDIVNPQGLVSFLRKKMKISARLGILVDTKDEYVNTGKFYVYSWPDDTQEDKASLTCRPAMAFENRSYENAGRGTQTANQAAAIIFDGTGEAYSVAAELREIEVNQYIGDDVPKIDAMGMLAVACCAYWKVARDGSYHLLPWKPPAVTNDIDYENAWSKPSISQRQRYTSVNVKSYAWDSVNEQQTNTDNIISSTPDDGEIKTISCPFITSARAETVARAVLAYLGLRLQYSISYRGDASIEAGDVVRVENDYAHSDVCVLNHEITFNEQKISAVIKGVGTK